MVQKHAAFSCEDRILSMRRFVDEKTVWKAERAWFLDRRKRRAKPGIELLLTRWGKSSVFLNLQAGAYGFFTI